MPSDTHKEEQDFSPSQGGGETGSALERPASGAFERGIRREAARLYPTDFKAQNAFLRSALGWVPPAGVRLTPIQRKAVSEGSALARAAIAKTEGRHA